MENSKENDSIPTLSELLEPYLRDPPSLPPPAPVPKPPPLAAVSALPFRRKRRLHPLMTRYYRVHQRDFRSLVQRLTGSAQVNVSIPTSMNTRLVLREQDGNGDDDEETGFGSEEREVMSPRMSEAYSACCSSPILSPRTMNCIGDFDGEEHRD